MYVSIGNELKTTIPAEEYSSLSFSNNYKHLTAISKNGYLSLVDFKIDNTEKLNEMRYAFHQGSLLKACWSIDSRYLITIGFDKCIVISSVKNVEQEEASYSEAYIILEQENNVIVNQLKEVLEQKSENSIKAAKEQAAKEKLYNNEIQQMIKKFSGEVWDLKNEISGIKESMGIDKATFQSKLMSGSTLNKDRLLKLEEDWKNKLIQENIIQEKLVESMHKQRSEFDIKKACLEENIQRETETLHSHYKHKLKESSKTLKNLNKEKNEMDKKYQELEEDLETEIELEVLDLATKFEGVKRELGLVTKEFQKENLQLKSEQHVLKEQETIRLKEMQEKTNVLKTLESKLLLLNKELKEYQNRFADKNVTLTEKENRILEEKQLCQEGETCKLIKAHNFS